MCNPFYLAELSVDESCKTSQDSQGLKNQMWNLNGLLYSVTPAGGVVNRHQKFELIQPCKYNLLVYLHTVFDVTDCVNKLRSSVQIHLRQHNIVECHLVTKCVTIRNA